MLDGNCYCYCSVDNLCLTSQPDGLQFARLPCPSPSPRACSNLCLISRWGHPTSHPLLSLLHLPSIFPSIRIFSNELALHIRWPKYWSFSISISPSNEYTRLISFRIDWIEFLAVKGLSGIFSNTIQKHQFFGAQPSVFSNSHIHIWLLEKS